LIVDASGLTISKKGDYIEEKWIREKKEFFKLHIAVDEKSKKVVSFRITKGNVHHTKKFGPLVKESDDGEKINSRKEQPRHYQKLVGKCRQIYLTRHSIGRMKRIPFEVSSSHNP